MNVRVSVWYDSVWLQYQVSECRSLLHTRKAFDFGGGLRVDAWFSSNGVGNANSILFAPSLKCEGGCRKALCRGQWSLRRFAFCGISWLVLRQREWKPGLRPKCAHSFRLLNFVHILHQIHSRFVHVDVWLKLKTSNHCVKQILLAGVWWTPRGKMTLTTTLIISSKHDNEDLKRSLHSNSWDQNTQVKTYIS